MTSEWWRQDVKQGLRLSGVPGCASLYLEGCEEFGDPVDIMYHFQKTWAGQLSWELSNLSLSSLHKSSRTAEPGSPGLSQISCTWSTRPDIKQAASSTCYKPQTVCQSLYQVPGKLVHKGQHTESS